MLIIFCKNDFMKLYFYITNIRNLFTTKNKTMNVITTNTLKVTRVHFKSTLLIISLTIYQNKKQWQIQITSKIYLYLEQVGPPKNIPRVSFNAKL